MASNSDSLPEEFPLIPEELWYERLLRYGLYLGGVFQIICILAVIFLPSSALQDQDKVSVQLFQFYVRPCEILPLFHFSDFGQ